MDDIVIEFPRRVFRGGRRWSRAQRTMAVSWVAGIAAVAALLPLAVGGGPRDDVQVVANATTEGSQWVPAVATLPDGKVVVVWQGAGPDDDAGIFARIRDPEAGFGPEFRVNEATAGIQGGAAVAADPTGNFLVAWSGPDAAGGGVKALDVFTRLFDSTGSPLRGEEVLNLQTDGTQVRPAIAAVGAGRFAVVFMGSGEEFPAPTAASKTEPTSDTVGIFLRYTGQVTEPDQVLVNSYIEDVQGKPAVAASGSTVMVVWSGAGPDDDDGGIFAASVTGSVAAPQFRVNTTTTGVQDEPAVVARGANDFAAVWSGAGPLDDSGIFSAPLDRSSPEVLVNGVTDGEQYNPAVAVAGSGIVTVAWDGAGAADDAGIYARRFDPRVNLQPVTTDIAINTTIDGVQRRAAVAGNSQGDYTVAFEGPGDGLDVYVRRFAVNDPPDVTDDAYTVEEDNILSGDVLTNDSDVDGDSLTASTTENPANGVLDLREDGTFDYTPTANFNGQDRFSYQADDGDLKSVGPAEVVITIQAVNDGGPTAVADGPYSATEDTQLAVSDPARGLLGNDTDPDPDPNRDTLTARLEAQAASGAVTISPDGTFTYLPTADFCGKDKFTYVASDGAIESAPGEVNIEVSCVVDPPRGGNDQYSIVEDGELAVPAPGVLDNDYHEADRGVSARLQEGPTSGTLVSFNEDGSFTYRPNQDFNGEDSFTYLAVDKAPPPSSGPPPADPLAPVTGAVPGSEPPPDPPPEPAPGSGQMARVTITVGAAEDTPVASDDAYFTPLGTELAVSADKGLLANDTDPDDGDLTVRLAGPPTRGKMVVFNPDGSFTYQPNPDFNGTELVTYEVTNQSGKTSTGRVVLAVGDQGGRIIATADRYQLQEDVSLTVTAPGVLANDVDTDGDKLALSVVTGVTHGTLELNQDGSLLYAPAPDFTGTDGFTYQVKDPDRHAATAEVKIVVRPADEVPGPVDPTTNVGPPGPVPPPTPPPPPPVEIKPVAPPQPASPEDLAAPVVPITVPSDGDGSVTPVAPPTVAVLPAEDPGKGRALPVKPLAAAGGGGLALAGLLAGLRSRRRLSLGQVENLPVD